MANATALLKGLRPHIQRLGWDVTRYPAKGTPSYRRKLILDHLNVDLVVDVGANAGQYGEELRRCGYGGVLLSFEPVKAAFEKLAEAAANDRSWTTVRSAVGARAGTLTMNVAANSVSSSALPMLKRHLEAAPESVYLTTEDAPVDRLERLADESTRAAQHPFLKIDTQGYEGAVLDGAETILTRFVGLEMELSLAPLYQGQMSLLEAVERLQRYGFRLAGLSTGFWDAETGETLQADGVFLRE